MTTMVAIFERSAANEREGPVVADSMARPAVNKTRQRRFFHRHGASTRIVVPPNHEHAGAEPYLIKRALKPRYIWVACTSSHRATDRTDRNRTSSKNCQSKDP